MPQAPTQWDYTALAEHYDKRANYAESAIQAMLDLARPRPSRPIADVGAGTGKLTLCLLQRGYRVQAVEPNPAMREIGIRNTAGSGVLWSHGTGEQTGLPDAAFDLVTFGSSFNVTDRPRTLREVARILDSRGWFSCMWNHRDLAEPIQKAVEECITTLVPGYTHGTRREDQREVIRAAGFFEEPHFFARTFRHDISTEDYLAAWRSHATLQRQAGASFDAVIASIGRLLGDRRALVVPYTTRVWMARKLA